MSVTTTETVRAPAATAPNGAHPGVVFAHRWVWVDYPAPDPEAEEDAWKPNPDYRGFRVQVLANPMGGEEIAERQARLATLKREITEDEYLQQIAWRVKAWNALSGDEEGTVVPIPAPGEAEGNWAAFRAIPGDLMAWVCETVRTINRPKPTPIRSSPSAGTTVVPPRPRDTPPEPETE